MFLKKTVFVIGAGASVEFGMPSGEKLKGEVEELLGIKARNSNTDKFTYFRGTLINQFGSEWSELLEVGPELSEALPSFISIDEALHYFSANERIVRLGKLAIGHLILQAERKSCSVSPDERTDRIDITRSVSTWLNEFLSIALSFARQSEISRLFENVSFVNFNYDRVLEQFLLAALIRRGRLSENTAQQVVMGLNVIRPYGSVGLLPWQDGGNIRFGYDPYPQGGLQKIADGIFTYAEQTDDRGGIRQQISKSMEPAELIVIIGFGFHQQNVALLKSSSRKGRIVLATAHGIDADNFDVFSKDLNELLGSSVRLFDRKGFEFMRALRPTISAAAA
jgi:hypothetical protein